MNVLEFVIFAVKLIFFIWANIYAISYAVYEFKRNKLSFLGVVSICLVGDILLLI